MLDLQAVRVEQLEFIQCTQFSLSPCSSVTPHSVTLLSGSTLTKRSHTLPNSGVLLTFISHFGQIKDVLKEAELCIQFALIVLKEIRSHVIVLCCVLHKYNQHSEIRDWITQIRPTHTGMQHCLNILITFPQIPTKTHFTIHSIQYKH